MGGGGGGGGGRSGIGGELNVTKLPMVGAWVILINNNFEQKTWSEFKSSAFFRPPPPLAT